jgi:hypothetical protein
LAETIFQICIAIHLSSTALESFDLKNTLELRVANHHQLTHGGLIVVKPMTACARAADLMSTRMINHYASTSPRQSFYKIQ